MKLPIATKISNSIAAIIVFLAIQLNAIAQTSITLYNPLGIDRPDEPLVWKRADLEKKLGAIPPGKYLVVTSETGAPLGVQLDDLDQDGQWDEAFFIHSFSPYEKFKLLLTVADHPAAIKMKVRAHVRMKAKNEDDTFGPDLDSITMPLHNQPTDFSIHRLPPYLTEGPAWENDKVAYRLYFDTRNAKDIYGKRIAGMVMDTVGANPDHSYHELSDWGMDILKVGGSLGAGALALYVPGQAGKDTLIRLGGLQVKKETYRKLADGPLRAVFRMDYEWEIAGRPVAVTEETSISAGQLYYTSKVIVHNAPPRARLVTGIANFYSNEPGNLDKEKALILYSYGQQSENKDQLGMAILIGKDDFAAFKSLPAAGSDITSTYTVSQYIHRDNPLYFRFYTAWERTDAGFAKKEYFTDMLKQEAEKFRIPIQQR